jgi:hypothetical protein
MRHWLAKWTHRLLNGGTPLLLMGSQWLYLWAFPWHRAYLSDPHWGHNYAEAIAFVAAGVGYFNRRLASDMLTLLAALLVIPASLELLPHSTTALVGAALVGLILLDVIVEHGREHPLLQSSNRRLDYWLRRHLPRFSYLLLAHIALVYFLVRLPLGTYETELVTRVYDAMLIVFVSLLLLEDMDGILTRFPARQASFFWGMLSIVVALLLLFAQPETRILLALNVIVFFIGAVGWALGRRRTAVEA